MTELSNMVAFPQASTSVWIDGYQQDCLDARCGEATVDAYVRILRQFTAWVAKLPGQGGQFVPSQLTTTAVERYLSALKEQGYSVSHRTRVKTVINGFCQWLIEEKQTLTRNPTRGVEIKAQQMLAPRVLSPDQRFVLHNLLEKEGDLRSKAIFALGYWAGCRVSDVSHLQMAHTEVGPKVGKLYVGHKQGKYRHIVLLNQARGPLYDYLRAGRRAQESAYVFTSQRETTPVSEGDLDGWRLSEPAIHEWFKQWKRTATAEEWELIADITFHDLRHDFAHRAKQEAGLDEGELAVYLGHITKRGMPAVQTTARYTQPSMDQVTEKLKKMKG